MLRPITATALTLAGVFGLAACSDTNPVSPRDLAAPAPDLAPAIPFDLGDVARPSCDQPLAGPELPAGSTESKPGFDELLAMTDVSQLPPRLDLGSSSDLTRSTIGYLLGQTYAQLGDALDRDAALAAGPLGKVVVGAFAAADPAGKKGADVSFLRRGLYRYYHCLRGYPLTLDGFRRVIWDYKTVPGRVITSVPKNGPRRLYESPELGVYVAETLIGDQVRETEIQVTRSRPDGSHDFLSYDDHGQQVRTSSFASGSGMRIASSPYTCMACHYDRVGKSFSAVVPN